MVKLGITTEFDFTPRYRGKKTATSCPSFTSARGSASITSARPPVLAWGNASEAAKRILMGLGRNSYAIGHPAKRQLYSLIILG
jgi:hypothetical protein